MKLKRGVYDPKKNIYHFMGGQAKIDVYRFGATVKLVGFYGIDDLKEIIKVMKAEESKFELDPEERSGE